MQVLCALRRSWKEFFVIFFLCEFESRCSARLINSLSALGCPTITVWGSFLLQKNHIETVFAGFWRTLHHYFCCCLKEEKKVFSLQARPNSPNHDRGALHGAEHRLPPWKIIRCECLGMIMRSKHLTKLGREGGDWRRSTATRAGERVSDSCDKLQTQNYLSIKLDFTNALLPDSPLTEEISQHYRAAWVLLIASYKYGWWSWLVIQPGLWMIGQCNIIKTASLIMESNITHQNSIYMIIY